MTEKNNKNSMRTHWVFPKIHFGTQIHIQTECLKSTQMIVYVPKQKRLQSTTNNNYPLIIYKVLLVTEKYITIFLDNKKIKIYNNTHTHQLLAIGMLVSYCYIIATMSYTYFLLK
jgi:hypothetical protein